MFNRQSIRGLHVYLKNSHCYSAKYFATKHESATRIPQLKGFTLVELLVVIAIISLLAAILIPTLNRAKDSAKQLVCQTNLKQTGSAIAMYVNDYNGRLPGSCTYWANYYFEYPMIPETYVSVFSYLGDYLGFTDTQGAREFHDIAICPSTPQIVLEYHMPSYTLNASWINGIRVSDIFGWKSQHRDPNPTGRPRKLSSLTKEELKIGILTDANQNNLGSSDGSHLIFPEEGIHNDGQNWLFFDGSVTWSDESVATH